jgi:hypothetical protein
MAAARNHRLAARELLAEAGALHAEGARGPAVRYLCAAAQAAVAAVVERSGGQPGTQLLPAVAAEALQAHGVAPASVREVLHDLVLDCHEQLRGAPTQLGSATMARAIDAVQALVDVASGLRRPIAHPAAPAPVSDPTVPEAMRAPGRPGPWFLAERLRRRRRRLRMALAGAAIAAVVGVAPTAAVILGHGHDPAAKLDVMARAGIATATDESSQLGLP